MACDPAAARRGMYKNLPRSAARPRPAQFQVHHPPGQILHALLRGEALLRPCVELPDLDGQGVLPLHLVQALVRARSALLERGEGGGTQQVMVVAAGGSREQVETEVAQAGAQVARRHRRRRGCCCCC